MRLLRWIGIALGAVVVLLAGVAIAARFSDGPIGPFAGGPLASGALVVEDDVDWSFAKGLPTLEFQLEQPPRSRTVWFVLHEGALYVPCGLPNFTLWKQWPHEALADGRAVLRLEGRRYQRQAVRVTDPDELAAVLDLVEQKYHPGVEPTGPDDVWVFRMDPRAS